MRAIISVATTRYSKLLFSKPNNRHIKTIVPSIIRNIMSESDHQSPAFTSPKMVVKKVLAKSQSEGDGATVRRAIGSRDLRNLDPFLMLDDFSVTPPAGFPDHPHRGFETVTYMLQWMTAGRGIVHSEMPAGEGPNTGLQLWINLSRKDKMIEPRYQELLSKDIRRAEKDGVEVKVIAGETMGVSSPVFTRTPALFFDFTLKPKAQLHQSIPETWSSFVYIIEGEGVFGSTHASAHHVLVLGPGDGLIVCNKSSEPLRFVLVGGQPINEPVVQHGPFVMNTQDEINQTIQDYHYGQNGFEMAKSWRSQ
ncbi:hypothetical protein ACE6H2_001843 [Prunus campanulata]